MKDIDQSQTKTGLCLELQSIFHIIPIYDIDFDISKVNLLTKGKSFIALAEKDGMVVEGAEGEYVKEKKTVVQKKNLSEQMKWHLI